MGQRQTVRNGDRRGDGFQPTRRQILKGALGAGAGLWLFRHAALKEAFAQYVAQNTLDPAGIAKYAAPMVIPPAMPRSGKIKITGGKSIDYYEIAVREFPQQILPPSYPATTVWSYGSVDFPGTVAEGGSFNYPAFTIESKWTKPARVKWINEIPGPHLLPVDPTLHWANPIGVLPDTRPDPANSDYWASEYLNGTNGSYTGPVPMVTHVHGAHTTQDSDGYPEAWYLPAGSNGVNWPVGTFYDGFQAEFEAQHDESWGNGFAVFQYPNDQRATTLWYHDHTLGMTRLNVYAGPAGFYIIRGGPDDIVLNGKGRPATLPGPAPALGDPPDMSYYEIPIVIQDRSFDEGGQLWYPNYRAFFEGLGDSPDPLQIPFTPDETLSGFPSDVAPIWQPEFFADAMVVNGVSWPYLDVEPQLYRFRLLNGCNSRFLILKFNNPSVRVFQIGADGGFLEFPVDIAANSPYPGMILMAPAERADVIVDFRDAAGAEVELLNFGPDEPFGGGAIGTDFEPANPATTGKVMKFNVGTKRRYSRQRFTDPAELQLPPIVPLAATAPERDVSLNEEESAVVLVPVDIETGEFVLDTEGRVWEVGPSDSPVENPDGDGYVLEGLEGVVWENSWIAGPFGPTAALLGTVNPEGSGNALLWMDEVTENPTSGSTEIWAIHNFTMDAHPIHIHLIQFQVIGRYDADGNKRPPEPGETGFKDTVIAYPDEITKVISRFDVAGRFVWHCHIVEHEDNEMMRPYDIG